MSLESLYPYAGDHAIQNAVFAVEFEGPLSSTVLSDMQKAAEKAFLREFPDIQPMQVMTLNIAMGQIAGNGSPQQMKAQPSPGGFVMNRSGGFAAMVARSLTVSVNSIVIVVNDYSRWEQVKLDVDRYLDVLLKAAQSHNSAVRTIGLQYTDVFNWKSDPKELILSEVINSASPYIAPNVFALPSDALWHSHHGYFTAIANPVSFSQLDNINVNKVETGGMHSLQFLTSHKARLTDPLWKISRENRPVIAAIQELLHVQNKAILGSLLSADVKAKIKLT